MTSLAFILGCVPLAIATGASANSRHSIGTGVIGGMLGATVIAVFFIPMFYLRARNDVGEAAAARRRRVPERPRRPRDATPPGTGSGGPTVTPSARREDD